MKFNNVDKVISIRNITREGYNLSWIHYHVLLITKCMQHITMPLGIFNLLKRTMFIHISIKNLMKCSYSLNMDTFIMLWRNCSCKFAANCVPEQNLHTKNFLAANVCCKVATSLQHKHLLYDCKVAKAIW